MVERITDPHRPVQLTHGCYRIPDGDVVPNPPRPAPEPPRPVKAGMSRSEQVGWSLVPVVALAVISLRALGVLP